MKEDLKTGDLHLATAIRMFGVEILENEELKKKKRYEAKQGNFALVYGADSFKLSQMLECSVDEAEEFMAEHRFKYPVLYAYMEKVKADAKRDGFVVNLFNRIRPIPELNEGSWKIREKAERECVNTVVQGTAVDIVKLMMLYMRKILDGRIRLVLQVHDEMLWECPDELLEQALTAHEELKYAFPDYPVEVKVGKIYGEVKKPEGE
jgi:DNA polymerase-1